MVTKLKKLTFQVGKKEIKLTEEEARGLHFELSKLFVKYEHPIYIQHEPYIYPKITYTGDTVTDFKIKLDTTAIGY